MTAATLPQRRIALVTGAARGIGAAIAMRLADDGHDVAVLDLNAAACAQTVAAVQARGGQAMAVAADVSNEQAVNAAIDAVTQAMGAPTILVNNAGLLRDRTVAKMTLDDWEKVMAVNLRGAFLTSRAAQSGMRAAGWGRIVNLSSTAALGAFGEANYAAAKAGIQGFTRSLALELGRYSVTVNAVAPGFVATDMTREVAERNGMTFEDMKAEMLKSIAVGRVGEPEDVAHAVSYFVDIRSGFVTGQTLYVAGAPRG